MIFVTESIVSISERRVRRAYRLFVYLYTDLKAFIVLKSLYKFVSVLAFKALMDSNGISFSEHTSRAGLFYIALNIVNSNC